MKKTFIVKEKCQACNGTGVFTGMGESDGFGIQCHTCKGTGCNEFTHVYEEFEFRVVRSDIKQVLRINPGIGVGVDEEKGLTLESFGGMPYMEWFNSGEFPEGSEMRDYVCPAWWYQSVDYDKKPKWCPSSLGNFSNCECFCNKESCWKRFDHDQTQ